MKDQKQIITNLKQLKEAIDDFLDGMTIDEHDEEVKKRQAKKEKEE